MQADPWILTKHEQWNGTYHRRAENGRAGPEAAEAAQVRTVVLPPYMESMSAAGAVHLSKVKVALEQITAVFFLFLVKTHRQLVLSFGSFYLGDKLKELIGNRPSAVNVLQWKGDFN